ncbi:MAG: hypothetical protein DRJ97_07755 [Thermoprotei archaeon]|nr:MAG: hypothetical protein DRJ97_07755 [Thermoprotei archaeon]
MVVNIDEINGQAKVEAKNSRLLINSLLVFFIGIFLLSASIALHNHVSQACTLAAKSLMYLSGFIMLYYFYSMKDGRR